MWCDKCQAEVPGVGRSDIEPPICTSCGTKLVSSVPAAAAQAPVAQSIINPIAAAARMPRDPRELLARWAQEDALDRIQIGSGVLRRSGTDKDKLDNQKPAVRYDGSHPVLPAAVSALTDNLPRQVPPALSSPAPKPNADEALQPASQEVVIHAAHETNTPHFTAVPVTLADKSTRWVTLAGQILAYVGVGGLTVGTSLVLLGYFAGPASYATTGWLVATVGQMLLFLGVVTLISGGMEQTTQEVVRRIDTLGNRLGRIEQVAFTGNSQVPSQQLEVKP
jgi:hypothetical protein